MPHRLVSILMTASKEPTIKGMISPEYRLSCGEHRFKILADAYVAWKKDLIVLKGIRIG